MDPKTLERLQDLLGEEDVWEQPPSAEEADGNDFQTTDLDGWIVNSTRPKAPDGWDDGGDVGWDKRALSESPSLVPAVTLGHNDVPSGELDGKASPDPYYDSDGVSYRQPKPIRRKRPRRVPQTGAAGHSSTETAFKPATSLKEVRFEDYGLDIGEAAPKKESFCPWDLMVNYPIHYIGNGNRDRCAPFFEADALLDSQTWDFFYIRDPSHQNRRAVYFVPTDQFQHLLDVVNATVGTELCIPKGNNAERFTLSFGEMDTPRPRFLGRTSSLAEFNAPTHRTPEWDPEDDLDKVSGMAKQMFLEKLDTINKGPSRRKQKKSEANRRKRIRAHRDWGRSIKRVQRYLGLRKALFTSTQVAEIKENNSSQALQKLDLGKPMAWQPEEGVVFVAVDVEWFEFDNNVVTEVGIATLDTRLIVGVAPGEDFQNWFKLIKARHLRVSENASAINRVHVQGRETSFNFGKSEFIDLDEMAKVVRAALEPTSEEPHSDEKLHVVLVGHDFASDIHALAKVGYNTHASKQLLEIVDTRDMYQYHRRSMDPRSLGVVLSNLGFRYANLHNAGNDAVYTLQAMVGIAIKHYQTRLAARPGSSVKSEALDDYLGKADKEGWSSGGELSDGGLPDPIINPVPEESFAPNEEEYTTVVGPW